MRISHLSNRAMMFCLIILTSVFLSSCVPNAEFTMTPNPATANEAVTFDASESTAHAKERYQKRFNRLYYKWTFGDGDTAFGKIAEHTYSDPGTYTVTLRVWNKKNLSDTMTQQLVVLPDDINPPDGDTQTVNVTVQSTDGIDIIGTEISIDVAMATTDDNGMASLEFKTTDTVAIVQASKEGFVSQSLQVIFEGDGSTDVFIILTPVKQTIRLPQAELAQVITGEDLGASVNLPANSLVDEQGQPVTGTVTVNMTPWDIQGGDMEAMPGNGLAIDENGDDVELISAGMITVDFFDETGNHLQLATDTTATILMHLPVTSVNNTTLTVGSEIPIWNFDEDIARWVQDGTGTVVEDLTSPTGLSVFAIVSHFSTWNWDFDKSDPGSVDVVCVDSSMTPQVCNIIAKVTLADGSMFTRSGSFGPETTTIINMPTAGTGATIEWEATTSGIAASRGTATSGTSGLVVIELAPPIDRKFVSCQVGTATVACEVELQGASSGSIDSYSIPESGAWINIYNTDASFDWSGTSSVIAEMDGSYSVYTGSVTTLSTDPSDTIVIDLNNQQTLNDGGFYIGCDEVYENAYTSETGTVTSCDASITIYDYNSTTINNDLVFELTQTLIPGQLYYVSIPANIANDYSYGYIDYQGMTTDGATPNRSEYINQNDILNIPPIDFSSTLQSYDCDDGQSGECYCQDDICNAS